MRAADIQISVNKKRHNGITKEKVVRGELADDK
jgi:hypothetical protein